MMPAMYIQIMPAMPPGIGLAFVTKMSKTGFQTQAQIDRDRYMNK